MDEQKKDGGDKDTATPGGLQLRAHFYLTQNAMIKVAKEQKPRLMYAGFYGFSLKGRTSQKSIREKILKKGFLTMPYFISCSSLSKDNMKDFRIIIQEDEHSTDAESNEVFGHQSCKFENGDTTTGYFIPMTKFEVIKVGTFSYTDYVKSLEDKTTKGTPTGGATLDTPSEPEKPLKGMIFVRPTYRTNLVTIK